MGIVEDLERAKATMDAAPAYTYEPALAKCARCGRSTWSPTEVGRIDLMTQPDGGPCGGMFK